MAHALPVCLGLKQIASLFIGICPIASGAADDKDGTAQPGRCDGQTIWYRIESGSARNVAEVLYATFCVHSHEKPD